MIWLTLVGVMAGGAAMLTLIGSRVVDRRYPPTGRMVRIDGVDVHCVERGKPSPDRASLLFVHGASSNHREFLFALGEKIADRFGPDQHVMFVDRPGQGGSQRRPGDHSPRVQADRILKVAQRLGAQRLVVVGHSWGGAVVAQMAVHGGAFVTGAVFAAPATHPWPGKRFRGVDWYYAIADTPVLGLIFTWLVTMPVAWFQIDESVETVFAPEPAKPGYARFLGGRLVLRPRAFRANAADVYRLRPFVEKQWTSYAQITCPVFILTGDEDGVVWPHLHADGLERDIAGARKLVIAGGGHMPHQTHPDLLLDGVQDVMERARRACV